MNAEKSNSSQGGVTPIPLTKAALSKVAPGTGWVPIADKRVSGLKLYAGTHGKTIYLRRRLNNRPGRDFKIAAWESSLSPEQIRKLAARLDAQIAEGVDPNAQRKAAAAAGVTLGEAFERLMEVLEHREKPIKPSTAEQYRLSWRTDLKKWESRPLASITGSDAEKLHRQRSKVSPSRANQAIVLLRQIFKVAAVTYKDAKGQPLAPFNPADQVSILGLLNRRVQRTGHIDSEQLRPWVSAVLGLSSRLGTGGIVSDLYLFTLLSGVRRNEAAHLQWEAVDLQRATFAIIENKASRPVTLPLSDYMVEILTRRKAEAGTRAHVFPAGRKSGPLTEWRHWNHAIAESSGVPFLPHDLRRTFITVAESLDLPPYVLKALVNHSLPKDDVTAGYIQMTPERLRPHMQRITDFILRAAGVRESAPVVTLRGVQATG